MAKKLAANVPPNGAHAIDNIPNVFLLDDDKIYVRLCAACGSWYKNHKQKLSSDPDLSNAAQLNEYEDESHGFMTTNTNNMPSFGTIGISDAFMQDANFLPEGDAVSTLAKLKVSYDSQDAFIEGLSSFMEEKDNHDYSEDKRLIEADLILTHDVVLDRSDSTNDDQNMSQNFKIGDVCSRADRAQQSMVAGQLRNDIFECTGYFFQLHRVLDANEDGCKFYFTCSRHASKDRQDEKTSQRYQLHAKDYYSCSGQVVISFSKANQFLTIFYKHRCHEKVINIHPPENVRKYVERLRGIPPRLIYLNMIRDAGTPLLESVDVPLITRRQVHNLWASMTQSAWRRHDKDDYLSAQILLDETVDYHLIEELQEPTVSLGFTTPFMHDRNLLILSEIKEIMVDATFGTNFHGFELYCVVGIYRYETVPLSYLLLDTRAVEENGKRGIRLTTWFKHLTLLGLRPSVGHSDKDFAEIVSALGVFSLCNPSYNHHLCLWHSLRAIDTYLKTRFKEGDNLRSMINALFVTARPKHLDFLKDKETEDWVLSNGSKRKPTLKETRVIRALVKRHLLSSPSLPSVNLDDNMPTSGMQFSDWIDILTACVHEILDYCRKIDQPAIFRYLYLNWYRPSHNDYRGRWEIASLSGRRDVTPVIPLSRTTMRLESHWKLLKKDYLSPFVRPRVDLLCHVIIATLVLARINRLKQLQCNREFPHMYHDFVKLWRKCSLAVEESTSFERESVFHTDRSKWFCSCRSYVMNSRYICKHLVSFFASESGKEAGRFIVSPPPRFHYQLFQHTSPLVSFDDSTLIGKSVTSNGGDADDLEDSLDSVDFLKEIQTFDLGQDENPDANEQDDEQFMKIREIFEWLSSDDLAKGNGKMQRKIKGYFKAPEAFIKDFEPIMRESQGKSRSSQTMRNAAAGYYVFRPVSDSRLNNAR
ncbi:hypothetical protein V1525DRAFT_422426 [Lipomyces kononenkoae]|uniref:Uncharacterized protein n=1 Tax=Lipomyces kononenkoae TaxID=34357 RepID=A0ACC3SS92_LIPKO